MEEIARFESISKTFFSQSAKLFSLKRKKIEVLKDLDLSIFSGKITALLGPNGCGKTTMLKLLSTLLLPNSGRVYVSGIDTYKEPIEVRRAVSFVSSEERSFYFRLTGMENLLFFASLYDLKKETAKARIKMIDGMLNIGKHLDIRYQEFSSGLKQKLNLLRGLSRNFSLLLLDEPIKSVDAESSARILAYIKDVLVRKEGRSVLLTTHNMEEIEGFADRFIIMKDCRVAADFDRSRLSGTKLVDLYRSFVS